MKTTSRCFVSAASTGNFSCILSTALPWLKNVGKIGEYEECSPELIEALENSGIPYIKFFNVKILGKVPTGLTCYVIDRVALTQLRNTLFLESEQQGSLDLSNLHNVCEDGE